MMSFLFAILILVMSVLIIPNVIFYFYQTRMIFYPTAELEKTPADRGLVFEDVSIKTSDGIRLHGWYIPKPGAREAVVFFHGNAGNISHRLDSIKIFNEIGLNVLIIDYRGYGKSEGSISEAGLNEDAQAAWAYLMQRGFRPSDIIIFGRSLGGAVAAGLASRVQARAVIIESAFSSIRDMARNMMPVVSRIIWLRFKLNTKDVMPLIHSPVLVMHSPQDEVIPYGMGVDIYNAANTPRYFYELEGDHSNGFMQSMPGYQAILQEFLERLDSSS